MAHRHRWLMVIAVVGLLAGLAGTALGAWALKRTSTSSASATSTTIATPTTSVLVPSNGATAKGTQILAASGVGVNKLEFHITGGKLSDLTIPAGLTFDGWVSQWNTTTVANGAYTIKTVGYDTNGIRVATSSAVTITVAN